MTSAELRAVGDLGILAQRPSPGEPKPYRFPAFERARLSNGLTLVTAHLPGRPLLAAQLILEGGAGNEPPEQAGVTALAARAITEGTRRFGAIEFIEAAERLGAEVHAESGWETFVCTLDVPRSRFAPALALLAEMVREPAFPEEEVDRLRDERVNDLLQARADPRRRAERAFMESIYAPDTPFSRPQAGTESTVPSLDREAVARRHRALLDPSVATLIVAGDLAGVPVADLVEEHLGGWASAEGIPAREPLTAVPNHDAPRVLVVDRPGAPQTQIRVGHLGVPRVIPDFHAVTVLAAILGGLFDSRLQRLLREERGYTYGVGAGFEFRRAAGPFAVRTGVQTEVTVPALQDIMGELRRIREAPVEDRELALARDYLVGVFPLRFEAPGQVVGALAGLIAFGLPDDELDRYRPAVAAVSREDVASAAERYVRPDEAVVVLVGDAARVVPELEQAGFGPVSVVRDEQPAAGTFALGVDVETAAAAAAPGLEPEPDASPDEPWPHEPVPAGLSIEDAGDAEGTAPGDPDRPQPDKER